MTAGLVWPLQGSRTSLCCLSICVTVTWSYFFPPIDTDWEKRDQHCFPVSGWEGGWSRVLLAVPWLRCVCVCVLVQRLTIPGGAAPHLLCIYRKLHISHIFMKFVLLCVGEPKVILHHCALWRFIVLYITPGAGAQTCFEWTRCLSSASGWKELDSPVVERALSSEGAASPVSEGLPRYLGVISGPESATPALCPWPCWTARASRGQCEQCVTSLERHERQADRLAAPINTSFHGIEPDRCACVCVYVWVCVCCVCPLSQ